MRIIINLKLVIKNTYQKNKLTKEYIKLTKICHFLLK